jgi:hypothetical protein
LPEYAKRRALIFLAAALVSTLLIGMGLSRLRFEPGMPLPSFDNGNVVVPQGGEAPAVGMPVSSLFIIVIMVAAAAVLGVAIYRLIKGTPWRDLLSGIASGVLIVVVILAIFFFAFYLLPKTQIQMAPEPLPVPAPLVTAPLGPVPPLLIWLVGFSLLAAAVTLGVWIYRAKRRPETAPWALEVESARQALLAGENLKNVILRCYQQMSLALETEQQIEREASMTTGEFERLLTAKGVPQSPVHQLTQLFDAVRYGHWEPQAGDEHRALECLDAILENSRVPRDAR